jgi:hypothetical protein
MVYVCGDAKNMANNALCKVAEKQGKMSSIAQRTGSSALGTGRNTTRMSGSATRDGNSSSSKPKGCKVVDMFVV